MENFKLEKGESKNVTLLEIKTQKEEGGRIYNCFFSGTLDEAKAKAAWLGERILVSAEPKEIEVHYNKHERDYLDDHGFLKTDDFSQNPNEDEEMKITRADVAEAEGDDESADFFRNIDNEEAD